MCPFACYVSQMNATKVDAIFKLRSELVDLRQQNSHICIFTIQSFIYRSGTPHANEIRFFFFAATAAFNRLFELY